MSLINSSASRFIACLRFGVVFSVFVAILSMSGSVAAQAINEDFADLPTLLTQGWSTVNHSDPVNTAVTGWSQCGGTAIPPAQAGASTACVLVNYQSGLLTATLNNWLIGPNRTFKNGDTISFYTRTSSNTYPDRLQLRLSTNGTSTNIGTAATDVGDFTTLLIDIDSDYSGTYPTVWTQYTATLSGLPAGGVSGRFGFRYFVENGGPDGVNSNIIGVDTLVYTPASASPAQHVVDFNGDGKTDYSVVRNVGGANNQLRWFYNLNGSGSTVAYDWGVNSDVLVPADYDGDGKTDIAVWRPGAPLTASFYILQSLTNTLRQEAFGQTGDDPTVVADYDGDGKADLAVYRAGATGAQSTWYYRTVANGPVTFIGWGVGGDRVAPGDYDGDGKADFAIVRNEGGNLRWWIRTATGSTDATNVFGSATDTVVFGDVDGDGKTDPMVVRSSGGVLTWYAKRSSDSTFRQLQYGLTGDTPAPGDYDGDGKTDVAIWRNGVFYVFNTSNSQSTFFQLGAAGDLVPASYRSH